MLNSYHYKAQELSTKAKDALSLGEVNKALKLFGEAAKNEFHALKDVPDDKIRTRSILAVSVASLYYKAQLLSEAEKVLFQLLGNEKLEIWAEQQLRELLQVVADEKLLFSDLAQKYSGESITLSLRGGEIGSGTGPLDLILEKVSGFRSLLYRFAEWVGEYPLRHRGAPSKEITNMIQARATEPSFGSYSLEIRLTEPLQIEMFNKKIIKPNDVADIMFQFLDNLTTGAEDQLQELVPDEDYRKAILQLTRNFTPTGKRIKEIGIYRKKAGKVQNIYLTESLPRVIKEVIPRKEKETEEKETKIRGTLRALHLDQNWLELHLPNGESVKCSTVHDMLDDVVGPMVNREVIVSGTKRVRQKLLVEDIELSEDGE